MSFDLRLTGTCSHLISEERLDFAANIVALKHKPTSEPILKLMGKNVLVKGGLYIPQPLVSSHFPDPTTEGGDLVLATPAETITLKFAPFEVNVKSAVKKLSSIPLILVKEVNGFICITPTGSVNYVVLSGDVAKDLGFISRKASLPVLVHPGYSYQDGIVTLRSPLLKDQFVTASYYCEETLCPRCKGSSVENDVSLDDLGDFEIVKDHDLLAQLVIKAVLTEIGSNVYHSWYGTSVSSLIGKTFNDDALSRVRTEVQDSIRRVQSQQTLQAKYQQVTLKERFGVLNSITLDRLDYRTLKLEIAHTSASGEPIVITQTFSTVGARNKLVTR